jgi:hypothetical protein
MIDGGELIRDENDLINIHNSISQINNAKTRNDIQQLYGKLLVS